DGITHGPSTAGQGIRRPVVLADTLGDIPNLVRTGVLEVLNRDAHVLEGGCGTLGEPGQLAYVAGQVLESAVGVLDVGANLGERLLDVEELALCLACLVCRLLQVTGQLLDAIAPRLSR